MVAAGGATNGGALKGWATKGGAAKGGATVGVPRYLAAAASKCRLICLLRGKRIDCLVLAFKTVCIGSLGIGSKGEFWLGLGGVAGEGTGFSGTGGWLGIKGLGIGFCKTGAS